MKYEVERFGGLTWRPGLLGYRVLPTSDDFSILGLSKKGCLIFFYFSGLLKKILMIGFAFSGTIDTFSLTES